MAESQQGVKVQTAVIPPGRAGQRLDNFLMGALPGLPRTLIYKMIRTGQVRVNGGRAKPFVRLQEGDRVRIPPVGITRGEPPRVPDTVREQLRAAVIFEDEDLVVVDKPAGMAVHAGSGIQWGIIDALRLQYPHDSLELVHRLDRDTSGCLLLARNPAILRTLHGQFRGGEVIKQYLCLLTGRLPEVRVTVDAPLVRSEDRGERRMSVAVEGKASRTEFRVLEDYAGFSFAEALPSTGRTHQIRVHAAHLGLPLAGDDKYSSPEGFRQWRRRGLRRLFLHAHALSLRCGEGQSMQFSCPLPAELRSVLDAL